MPAEWPGTSLICMSICPNKNIWFEAKPAPRGNEKQHHQNSEMLRLIKRVYEFWSCTGFLVELQTHCLAISWSVYMARRPCDKEIFVEVTCWNNGGIYGSSWYQSKKKPNKYDNPVILSHGFDSGFSDEYDSKMFEEAIYIGIDCMEGEVENGNKEHWVVKRREKMCDRRKVLFKQEYL